MSKGRLEAFSDGVFAVAITLLILDVRPEGNGLTGSEMLANDWHKILIFILSFVMVGVYWVAHHHMMHFVAATDRILLWLNLMLLLVIVFIPYVAALLSASHADPSAIRIYGTTPILTNLSGTALWAYAVKNHRLVHPAMPPAFGRFVLGVHTAPVLIYGLAIMLASKHRLVSFILFAAVLAFFILPNPWLQTRIRRVSEMMRAHDEKQHEPSTASESSR
jgi:uncharacterized membrane protein